MTEPIHIISLGVGVQSSTLAFMASEGEIGPKPTAGIFADTKHEPRSVYEYLNYLCGAEVKTDEAGRAYVDCGVYESGVLKFPVHVVSNGDLRRASVVMHTTPDGRRFSQTNIPFFTRNHDGSEGKIPTRGCTRDFKLVPLVRCQRKIVGRERMLPWRRQHRTALSALAGWARQCKSLRRAKTPAHLFPVRPRWAWDECQADPLVISWIGISLDEISRVKESRQPWVKSRWPHLEIGFHRQHCVVWITRHGYRMPVKSACKFCPFHDDDEWRRLRDEEPFEFADAGSFEAELQHTKAQSDNFTTTPYLHRQLVPLGKVDFSTEEERGQLNMFNNECEGMCGV